MVSSTQVGFEDFLKDVAPFFYRHQMTYVDVGAYDGAVFQRLLDSKLRVREAHLVEPNPGSIQAARARIGSPANVKSLHYYNLALGDRPGRVRMAAAGTMTKVVADAPGQGVAPQGLPDNDYFDIECSTLDELAGRITERHISLLKIDVEGFEDRVLNGAGQLLRDQSVDMIYVEAGMNPDGTQQCYYRKIEDILLAYGYRLFRIYEQKAEWMQDSPLLRRVDMAFMSRRFADANPMQLSRELFQAQRDLTRAQGDLAKAQEDLSKVQTELSKSKDEFAKAKQDSSKAQVDLVKAQNELEAAQGTLSKRGQELSTVQGDLAKVREELTQARTEQAGAVSMLTRVQSELGKSQAQLASSERSGGELRRQLAASNKQRSAMERERVSLSDQMGVLRAQKLQFGKAESYIPLLMRSIGETHQRVLAAQSDAQRARRDLDRIKRSRTYRAVRAVAANRRSLGGWFTMIPALWSSRLREPADPLGDSRLLTMDFSGEQAALTVPLASRQKFSLPASPRAYDVVVKLYSPTVDALPIPIQLNLGSQPGRSDRTLELIRSADIAAELSPGMDTEVHLPVWTTVHLLRVPAGDEPFVVVISGAAARECELKLWLRGRTDVGTPSTRRRARPASASSEPVAAIGIASMAANVQAKEEITSEELDAKLWGGYATYALKALEQRKLDTAESPQEREAAAWFLARWYYAESQIELALEQVRFTRTVVKQPQRRIGLLEAQCLVHLGRYKEADTSIEKSLALWPEVARVLKLYRSTVARHLALERGMPALEADGVQLDLLNESFTKAGLARLEKRVPDRPLGLANIVVRARPKQADQSRKVSVVLPCFNAESSIEWVIDGLLQQTWSNLEIIVVDDLSTDRSAEVVAEIAARDSRVRLVKQARNSGAYAARNAGARLATGHFITVHDSDDWSHPEKIEREIELLDASPGKVGVITHWVRVSEQLDIVGPWVPRGSLFDVNFSSLLFQRKVLDEIGYWDEVRVSGDAEFYYRLRWVYGEDCIAKLPSRFILSLSLARDDSLTRSKATHLRSLFYGLRRNYREAYLSWSSNPVPDADTRVMDPETGRRKFPLPIGCLHGSNKDPVHDLIVIADFAEPLEADAALAAMTTAQRDGQRVAAFHWRKYERSAKDAVVPEFHRACVGAGFTLLSPGDHVSAAKALVFEPSILEHKIDPTPNWQAGAVDVVLLSEPTLALDPVMASRHVKELFGVGPCWVGMTEEVHAGIRRDARLGSAAGEAMASRPSDEKRAERVALGQGVDAGEDGASFGRGDLTRLQTTTASVAQA